MKWNRMLPLRRSRGDKSFEKNTESGRREKYAAEQEVTGLIRSSTEEKKVSSYAKYTYGHMGTVPLEKEAEEKSDG